MNYILFSIVGSKSKFRLTDLLGQIKQDGQTMGQSGNFLQLFASILALRRLILRGRRPTISLLSSSSVSTSAAASGWASQYCTTYLDNRWKDKHHVSWHRWHFNFFLTSYCPHVASTILLQQHCLKLNENKLIFILVVFQRFVEAVQLSRGCRVDQSAVQSGDSKAGHQSWSEHLLLQMLWNLPFWSTQGVKEHLEVPGENKMAKSKSVMHR